MTHLLTLSDLTQASIIRRPSSTIKTPYVADILLSDNITQTLGHTPSLGCGGVVESGCIVYTTSAKTSASKCSHTVQLALFTDMNSTFIQDENKQTLLIDNYVIIGAHPNLAEQLAEICLKSNLLSKLCDIKRYTKQVQFDITQTDQTNNINTPTIISNRFDFYGLDNKNIPFIMEVKNVPQAHYLDLPLKELKKHDFKGYDFKKKIAFFPDGFRKVSKKPVSERAIKQLDAMILLKKHYNIRCIVCYVIQRDDVVLFQPSIVDPTYKEKLQSSVKHGVELITVVVRWTHDGHAYFVRDDLPIKLD